jgi:cytochrome c-type biogenesis protein CcsB
MNVFLLTYLLLCIAMAADFAGVFRPARRLALVAVIVTAAAWAVQTFGLIARGLSAGHWPLTDRYEFALCFAWAIIGVYLLQKMRWRGANAVGQLASAEGAAVMALALLVVTYALTRPVDERAVYPLLPALRSVWLQIHVLSAAIGYGACGVAAGQALTRVLMARHSSFEAEPGREAALPSDSHCEEGASPTKQSQSQQEIVSLRPAKNRPDSARNDAHPLTVEPSGMDRADRRIERTVAWGFPWLTLSILTGAIWAQEAWGRYWGWDPKETWALITWLWYLLVLHLRSVRGWRGIRLAVLVVAGFVIVLFAFAGLPWLIRTVRLTSLHGF